VLLSEQRLFMMTKVRSNKLSRLSQGDIFKDVEMVEYIIERNGLLEYSKIVFPLIVVLTQDCDLEQDHKFRRDGNSNKTQDKWIMSILLAPLYNVEHVYQGEHLSELDLRMEIINKTKSPGKTLRNNERPRYHYLSFPPSIPITDSVVDFKHYFSVNGRYLHRLRTKNFVCRLAPLFREDLSQRFAAYSSRIGLPQEFKSHNYPK